MIKGVMGGAFVNVSGGHSIFPYIPANSNNPIQGMIRIRDSNLEVFDGSSWIVMTTDYTTVELNHSAQSAISWAIKKMQEEAEMEQLASQHPAVKAAYENMKRASEQLKTTIILSKEVENSTVFHHPV
jgi:hypothetical protein